MRGTRGSKKSELTKVLSEMKEETDQDVRRSLKMFMMEKVTHLLAGECTGEVEGYGSCLTDCISNEVGIVVDDAQQWWLWNLSWSQHF